MTSAGGIFSAFVRQRLKVIEAMREELLEAWIAKHGFDPDNCEIVSQLGMLDDVPIDRIFVRKRGETEEIAELKQQLAEAYAQAEAADTHSVAELRRYREREPLVQEVIELSSRMESEDGWWIAVRDALSRLRDFKLSASEAEGAESS